MSAFSKNLPVLLLSSVLFSPLTSHAEAPEVAHTLKALHSRQVIMTLNTANGRELTLKRYPNGRQILYGSGKPVTGSYVIEDNGILCSVWTRKTPLPNGCGFPLLSQTHLHLPSKGKAPLAAALDVTSQARLAALMHKPQSTETFARLQVKQLRAILKDQHTRMMEFLEWPDGKKHVSQALGKVRDLLTADASKLLNAKPDDQQFFKDFRKFQEDEQ